jgi:gliding motility-associated-like protein
MVFIYYGTGVSSQIVSVFHNQSSGGTFAFVRQDFTLPAGVVGGPSTIADLDGDGKPEIVITSQLTNTFRILKNNTTAGVINASSFTVSAPYTITAPRAVKAGDINLDGKPDLIFISVPNTLSVLQNLMPSASIAFTTQPVSVTAICTGGTASFTVAATGDNNLQYQWQIDNGGFVDLTNDAIFSGVNTATLTITNAPFSLNGKSFRALVHGDATLNTASANAVLPMDPKLCNVPPDITPTTVASNINGTVTLDLADLITDVDNNLDLSTLRIITQPSSGAQASIDANYNLIISYTGKPFSGQDVVLIEVCDLAGSCTQEEIIINVIGDITVYNAVSNNGDGLNDFLTLEYIDFMEETRDNHVIIYNRWGDVVFEIKNYDNKERVFRGLNKDGKELAPGTYFYRIEFGGNGNQKKRSDQTGFLTLK